MTDDLIYVYCIANKPPDLKLNAQLEGLKCIQHEEFYAVVKTVSATEFSENDFKQRLSDIDWVERHVREHIDVICKLMEQVTVIPFKFGTIYHTLEGLNRFMREYSDSLFDNFHNVQGKEEWSVKIYCDSKVLKEQVDRINDDVARLEKQILASSPGKAFLLKRKKDDLIENETSLMCKKYGQSCYEEFNNLSHGASLNNIIQNEITGKKETMILNASFLVNKSKIRSFIDTVNRLSKEDTESGFLIEASGPWPPFGFISIKEKEDD